MHELGIVFHIIDQVKKVAYANKVSHVNKVTLEVGEVSTLIPSYLIDCWNWAVKKEEIMSGCVLDVVVIEAKTYCTNCCKTYKTVEFGKICPYCKSEETYLIEGNEKNIKEIEVV